jgi:hypothetical protein
MDGFYTTDGINCMGYYTAQDLPFYYSLFNNFTLCVSYFCSVLGPTCPATRRAYGYRQLDGVLHLLTWRPAPGYMLRPRSERIGAGAR